MTDKAANGVPPLTLEGSGLLSKWGFGDGDLLMDWWHDLKGDGWDHEPLPADNHTALRALVETHLLPVVREAGHEFEVGYVTTVHNPIRIHVLDGAEVDDREHSDALDHVRVVVPGAEVLAALAEAT